MRGLRGALEFLTTLPVGKLEWPGTAMLPWFPVAGLIIGGVWMAADAVLAHLFAVPLRAGLDVLVLILVTGGLHLDGLGDTADGLLSHRGPEEALRIMKDSRIGSWGVLALLTILGLKWLALAEILARGTALPLLMAPVYGRMAMLAGFARLPYGRGQQGIAHTMFDGMNPRAWLPGLIPAVLASLLLGWPGCATAWLAFLAALWLILRWYRKSMGCVTGDMLGALGEMTETVVLVVLAARI